MPSAPASRTGLIQAPQGWERLSPAFGPVTLTKVGTDLTRAATRCELSVSGAIGVCSWPAAAAGW